MRYVYIEQKLASMYMYASRDIIIIT